MPHNSISNSIEHYYQESLEVQQSLIVETELTIDIYI